MPQERAVGDVVDERRRDFRQRRHERAREDAALRDRLVEGCGDQDCRGCPYPGSRAFGAHRIIPQRTTVKLSSRSNTSFSRTRPAIAITAMPASIKSVFKNSRAPKTIEPRPN